MYGYWKVYLQAVQTAEKDLYLPLHRPPPCHHRWLWNFRSFGELDQNLSKLLVVFMCIASLAPTLAVGDIFRFSLYRFYGPLQSVCGPRDVIYIFWKLWPRAFHLRGSGRQTKLDPKNGKNNCTEWSILARKLLGGGKICDILELCTTVCSPISFCSPRSFKSFHNCRGISWGHHDLLEGEGHTMQGVQDHDLEKGPNHLKENRLLFNVI